jgi:hypothetical protein
MRTIPTILAAAAIAVGTTVLSVPVAPGWPWQGCESTAETMAETSACTDSLVEEYTACSQNNFDDTAAVDACEAKVQAKQNVLNARLRKQYCDSSHACAPSEE